MMLHKSSYLFSGQFCQIPKALHSRSEGYKLAAAISIIQNFLFLNMKCILMYLLNGLSQVKTLVKK